MVVYCLHSNVFLGITEHNWLECKGAAGASHICSNKFGKLCIIKINGEKRRLAKWEIKAIKFISEGRSNLSFIPDGRKNNN